MSQGGIYDHLGGGFARYSTDEVWLVPHFEKMLYDNAQLLELLALAHADRPNPLYARRATETVGWMMRDMSAQRVDGLAAFAASEDADSEGEEGRFYVWSEAEVDALLGLEAAAFKQAYDVTASGNWEGHTILRRITTPGSPDQEARLGQHPGGAVQGAGKSGAARMGRQGAGGLERPGDRRPGALRGGVWPDRMAGPGARGVRLHPDPDDRRAWRCRACMAARPGHGTGFDRRSGRDGTCGARPRMRRQVRTATSRSRERLANAAQEAFGDSHGGFFTTAADAADVPLSRPRSAADNATPSGNGMMAEVLGRLFHLTGDAGLAGARGCGAQGVQWPAGSVVRHADDAGGRRSA